MKNLEVNPDVPMFLLIDDDSFEQVGRASLPELQEAWNCDTFQQTMYKIDKGERLKGFLVIEDDECPYFQHAMAHAEAKEESAYLSEDDKYIYYYTNHGRAYRIPYQKSKNKKKAKREFLETEMYNGHICLSIEDEDGSNGEYWDITALIKKNFPVKVDGE